MADLGLFIGENVSGFDDVVAAHMLEVLAVVQPGGPDGDRAIKTDDPADVLVMRSRRQIGIFRHHRAIRDHVTDGLSADHANFMIAERIGGGPAVKTEDEGR